MAPGESEAVGKPQAASARFLLYKNCNLLGNGKEAGSWDDLLRFIIRYALVVCWPVQVCTLRCVRRYVVGRRIYVGADFLISSE